MSAPDYRTFLAGKRVVSCPTGITSSPSINGLLFPFQRDIVAWALRRGRAALFEECGLGKTWQALEWARVVNESTGRPVLIMTPLAVASQFVAEGIRLGIAVTHCREARDVSSGINVTNYERLERFDCSMFGGVVLDESSILKSYDSKTRGALIASFSATPFRLACTATPAPNDHMELGNHAEFLGVMSRTEMLSMFFVHDGGSTQSWRLKGHAEDDFWRWVCSWAVCLSRPSDLGYSNTGYDLPPLSITEHVVQSDVKQNGLLFSMDASTLEDQRAARKASMKDRVGLCAALVNASDEQWIVWCDLNDESDALARSIPGSVEVRGSDDQDHKESSIAAFCAGDIRVMVTKPSIAGWGVNMQSCHNAAFVGLSHSFELWHQANRRIWRFGQRHPVNCHVITSTAEGAVVSNIKRKQADAERMVRQMVRSMADISAIGIGSTERTVTSYVPNVKMTVPEWIGSEEA